MTGPDRSRPLVCVGTNLKDEAKEAVEELVGRLAALTTFEDFDLTSQAGGEAWLEVRLDDPELLGEFREAESALKEAEPRPEEMLGVLARARQQLFGQARRRLFRLPPIWQDEREVRTRLYHVGIVELPALLAELRGPPGRWRKAALGAVRLLAMCLERRAPPYPGWAPDLPLSAAAALLAWPELPREEAAREAGRLLRAVEAHGDAAVLSRLRQLFEPVRGRDAGEAPHEQPSANGDGPLALRWTRPPRELWVTAPDEEVGVYVEAVARGLIGTGRASAETRPPARKTRPRQRR